MKALITLEEQLPKDFPAPLLIVQYISADATEDALLNSINKIGKLKCIHFKHGNHIERGYIYFAPSDHHLIFEKDGSLLLTKIAQENRSRPAIEPCSYLRRFLLETGQ